MISVLLRIVAYISVPLIVGFAKKGTLTGKQCTLIAFVWALIVSTLIAFMTSGGAEAVGMILGGCISGTFIGDLAIFIASKPKKVVNQASDENNEIQVGVTKEVTYIETVDDLITSEQSGGELEAEKEPNEEIIIEPIEEPAAESQTTNDSIEDMQVAEVIENSEKEEYLSDAIPEEALRALKSLFDAGVLTEQEFAEKKRKLLNI